MFNEELFTLLRSTQAAVSAEIVKLQAKLKLLPSHDPDAKLIEGVIGGLDDTLADWINDAVAQVARRIEQEEREAENEDLIRRRGGTLRARESVWPLPPRAAE